MVVKDYEVQILNFKDSRSTAGQYSVLYECTNSAAANQTGFYGEEEKEEEAKRTERHQPTREAASGSLLADTHNRNLTCYKF